MNIVTHTFNGNQIRIEHDDEGSIWFNANDVCAALELANPYDAVSKHVDADDLAKREVIDSLGRTQKANYINESGLYSLILGSTKPEAKAFKRWVTSEVLPAIRKTGSYTHETPTAIQPSKEYRALYGIARLIGLDRNAAALSANRAVSRLTGTDVLDLLGQKQLTAEDQEHLYLTPTDLGKELGVSGMRFNQLLAAAMLQTKVGGKWEPTEKAKGLFRVIDSDKRRSDGSMITQTKWSTGVLALVK